MSQGEGGGRPRKHPHDPAIGQIAMDAEWQEIADGNTEKLIARNQYGSMNALQAIIDDTDDVNTKVATIILATRKIAEHADVNNIDTLYECLEEYMKLCVEHHVRITNSGAYSACGLRRDDVKDWALGIRRASDPAYKEFALFIRGICSESREMLMAEGKIHPVVGIWWQKNYDAFRDQPENYEEDVAKDETLSASEIADKYSHMGDD